MWIVNIALKRPVTVIVALVAVALCALLAVTRMKVDIFPDLDMPVIYVVQPYGGMSPAQMEAYFVSWYEYHFLYIPGVEHIESRSIQSTSVLRIYFHPGVDMSSAMAQVVAQVERAKAFMPPGTVSPFILRFDTGSVPVGYLVFSSAKRGVGEIQDLALYRVRPLFATLPGVSAPPPFGGNQRSIVITIDPDRLRAYRLSPEQVVEALSKGMQVIPSGNVYTGTLARMATMNATVSDIQDLQSLPLKLGAGATVFLRDVGVIKDATDIPTGFALVNGRRTVYIPVTKRADASTLSVVEAVKANLKTFRALVPPDIHIDFQFDQSVYVMGALKGVAFEGLIGAFLTGVMVLLFLRDLRSSLVVVLNIPFALLAAVVGLWLAGQTINIMTLGGLALAVGILVDEATVAIENIHTHLSRGETIKQAVFAAASEIAVPQLLAMLSVVAVFMPSFFMVGSTRALFVPLSLSVGFAMASSYVLSRTLVPVCAVWLLKNQKFGKEEGLLHQMQKVYGRFIERLMKVPVLGLGMYFVVVSLVFSFIVPGLGKEIFPSGLSRIIQLRMSAPEGTKIETTEELAVKALAAIEREVGARNVVMTLSYVGTQPPSYAISNVYMWTAGPHQAVLLLALNKDAKIDTGRLKEKLRKKLPQLMPGVRLSFEAGNIIDKIMNFGAPAPIELDVSGPSFSDDRYYASRILALMRNIPHLRDVGITQPLNYPVVNVDINRERCGQLGVTVEDVGHSLVPAIYSSRFVTPVYWCDEKSGNAYQVQVEYPLNRMQTIKNVEDVPVMHQDMIGPYVRDLARVEALTMIGEYDRYNMQRMISITANIYGEDLGRASAQVAKAVKAAGAPPRGVSVNVRGQVPSLQSTFTGLETGLILAVLVIIMLLIGYFQSPRLALVVVCVVPAVLAGSAVMLFVTGTTLNVQSFMGCIMAIGVGVANSILVVTFAEHNRLSGADAHEAAVYGAESRLRPVLMTSCAMIIGMIPMALGLSEGGHREAPLARAVIGGLLASSTCVLLVLPLVFALIQKHANRRLPSLHPDDDKDADMPDTK